MKGLFFLLAMTLIVTNALIAQWTYTCQTTWNGTIHVDGSTSFTPGSTTAYVRMDSPDVTLSHDCPTCSEEPPDYRDYFARATLAKPSGLPQYDAKRRCGGCATRTCTVTTTETWILYAAIDNQTCDGRGEEEFWGPVRARASSVESLCQGTNPGGE